MKKKWFAILLSLTISISMLGGCSDSDESEEDNPIRVNETISDDSKWINSDIDGAIDAETETNLKDDYYTAVNKDWLLQQTVTEDEPSVSTLGDVYDITVSELVSIANGSYDSTAESDIEIDPDDLKHDKDLVTTFAGIAGNWEQRNETGVEAARKYIEAIQNIQSIDEMKDYILNKNGDNLTAISLLNCYVSTSLDDMTTNRVLIDNTTSFSLYKQSYYTGEYNLLLPDQRNIVNEEVEYLLTKLGYSKADVDSILSKCYAFEGDLSDHMPDTSYQGTEDYLREGSTLYKKETVESLQGNYPLIDLLEKYGYADTDQYLISDPSYVKYVGSIFNKEHLNDIKAYYVVQTAIAVLPLLDRETYDKANSWKDEMEGDDEDDGDDDGGGDQQEQEVSDDDSLLVQTLQKYISGPLDTVYVSTYCTSALKQGIKELIDEIIAQYRDMIKEEDWLSEEARDATLEKLEAITVNAVYPDNFKSYAYLDFSNAETLPDLIAVLNDTAKLSDASKIDQKVDHHEWDLEDVSTSTVNAYYMPSQNSINILAGILAGGLTYNLNDSKEEQMAKIGTIIGHEITHAFDTTGCMWDKDGNYNQWWSTDDIASFTLRSNSLIKYYNAITPYPGASTLNGSVVSGEAIADMGGMKCMLQLAKKIDNFNYDTFFRAYADLWKEKNTFKLEESYVGDAHPLNFLRVNVTLQQFEEFYETYDIKKGDGMYLAKKKRISVW